MGVDFEKLAASLSPAQRHCILRFSEAEEWGRSGNGMGRTWPDIVYGHRGAQFRSIGALIRHGLAEEQDAHPFALYRLTPLGLSVQLHVRCSGARPNA